MSRAIMFLTVILLAAGCRNSSDKSDRIPVAEVGSRKLYYDEIPDLKQGDYNKSDSTALIRNYINKWAKRELLKQKAESGLPPDVMKEIETQLDETKANLVIYEYQRKMMAEKMDTVITDSDAEKYYNENRNSFLLSSNIVKALYIKIPLTAKETDKIRTLAKSTDPKDFQLLESLCKQYAEKFDDFRSQWIPMNRISVQLQDDILNEEAFLKKYKFYESRDSRSVNLLLISDYRLRSAVAPFEYVINDIKRIIWNARRFDFLQSLENGIYNEALKANNFKIY